MLTTNATAACRLVGGEPSPSLADSSRLVLTADNHNSVNGIREYARARGAETTYVPSVPTELRVDERHAAPLPDRRGRRAPQPLCLSRPSRTSPVCNIRSPGSSRRTQHGWDVLLDAAAYVPTNRLDLSRCQAGLRRPLFLQDVRLADRRRRADRAPRRARQASSVRGSRAGRSSPPSSSASGTSPLRARPHFEDGTVNFLNLPAVEIGLRLLDRIGIEVIHRHARSLARWLLDVLGSLQHSDGSPAATHLRAAQSRRLAVPPSRSTFSTPTAASSTSATSIASHAGT